MKFFLRFIAVILSGAMLLMGGEALLPQFPSYMSRATGFIFIFLGFLFALYGITGKIGFRG